ncbi:MAG TPA: hypothetical protein VFW25_07895 [Silvibacterium sp.]|nr:hypothetical protein [Silvibacterium sp.]
MRSRIKLLALLALCALFFRAAGAAQTGSAPKPAVFPHISSYSLSRSKLNLPADFAGQLNLLLISFQPEQQTQIQTWLSTAQGLQHTNFNFHWYRMPVSSRENIVFRWWDNSSMRSDETDPEMWPWIIPLYVDKDTFRRGLQISGKGIALLLVNKQGSVLWRADGAITADKRASLIAAVAASSK